MASTSLQLLTLEQAQERAPSAFATAPSARVSRQYQFVRTADLIPILSDHGFGIVGAQQMRAQKRNPLHIRHRLTFAPIRALDTKFGGTGKLVLNESIPQVHITNSHDLTTRLILHAGFYRLVCENGLIVSDSSLATTIREKHNGDLSRTLERQVTAALEGIEAGKKDMDRWLKLEVTPELEQRFAREALNLRFGAHHPQYQNDQVLIARRAQDEGNSLWRLMNRVQENLTRHSIQGQNPTGRAVRSKPIAGITTDTNFNVGLWRQTTTFADFMDGLLTEDELTEELARCD